MRVQRGVVRTNCLDCLNRSNMAQTTIGRALPKAGAEARAVGSGAGAAAAAGGGAAGATGLCWPRRRGLGSVGAA